MKTPPIENLNQHYKELLQRRAKYTGTNLRENKITENFECLITNITKEEIKLTIRKLKNNKAPGDDCITNEMIKCSDELMISKIEKLFNEILISGYYPRSWSEGLILSIHKSGKREDPNNYRGITLSNTLGKLFNTILYNRLIEKLLNTNIVSPAQAGFRKDHRTLDHNVTLFNLIKKYIPKGKYLYTCFVDFQKAYDTIPREALKQKLEHNGISGNFLNIIHSMTYKSPSVSLLYKDKVTEPFQTTIGLKQGDILSTIFFNLFINDLPTVLEETNLEKIETPMLGDTNISSLLFADDLAIFSLSQKELQSKIIDILDEYCHK